METFIPQGRISGPILPRFVLGMKMSTDAKMLYAMLCDFSRDTDHCWPSQAMLACLLSCSVTSVKTYLKELVAHKLISVQRNSSRGRTSTYYLLRPSGMCSSSNFSRPGGVKSDYPQAKSDYRINVKKEEIKSPPYPPNQTHTQRPPESNPGGGDIFPPKKHNFKEANTLFERFFAAYPRHEAKEPARAAWHQAWRRGSLPSLDGLLACLDTFKTSSMWQREHGRFVPFLVNWLRGQRWLDSAPSAGTPEEERQEREREAAFKAEQERFEQKEEQRRAANRAKWEREWPALRPAFEAFAARFPDEKPNIAKEALWRLLHENHCAPLASDVPEGNSLSMLQFLWQCRRGGQFKLQGVAA